MIEVEELDLKPGDILAGKYRVDRVLGAGGMGVVVAATHTVLNDKVALKFLLPSIAELESVSARFLREAQAAARIKSEHVARVMDVGTLDSGSPYMVMEYLEGKDLGTILKQSGPLDPELAAEYGMQVCEGLAAAHSARVIHRDIKPANLFVTIAGDGSPVVRVLDFGISKVSSSEASLSLTKTQTAMGSPLYMSPEQMRSARAVDSRTDIWSLGIVLFEALTSRVPFTGDSMPELCARVLEDAPPDPHALRPEVPEGLAKVVLRCLEKDPATRFRDVGELANALTPFAGEYGRSSTGRASRILDGAGLGKTVSEVGARRSVASASELDVAGPTSHAFGRTDSTVAGEAPQKKPPVLLAAGAAILVLAVGWAAMRPSDNHAAPAAAKDLAAAPSVKSATGSDTATSTSPVVSAALDASHVAAALPPPSAVPSTVASAAPSAAANMPAKGKAAGAAKPKTNAPAQANSAGTPANAATPSAAPASVDNRSSESVFEERH